jgi:hypothetical protein
LSQRAGIDLRSRGEGMFWAALGIVIQVSGYHGEPIAVAAWVAVGFGAILFAFGSPGLFRRGGRRKCKQRRRSHDRSLGVQAQECGDKIVQFKRNRDADEPRVPVPDDSLHRRRRSSAVRAHSEAITRHSRETVSLYMREHAADARALVHAICARGVIGDEEARRLCRPTDPRAIELVGLRLIELGELLVLGRLDAA